jgi:hypothetical protein
MRRGEAAIGTSRCDTDVAASLWAFRDRLEEREWKTAIHR